MDLDFLKIFLDEISKNSELDCYCTLLTSDVYQDYCKLDIKISYVGLKKSYFIDIANVGNIFAHFSPLLVNDCFVRSFYSDDSHVYFTCYVAKV